MPHKNAVPPARRAAAAPISLGSSVASQIKAAPANTANMCRHSIPGTVVVCLMGGNLA